MITLNTKHLLAVILLLDFGLAKVLCAAELASAPEATSHEAKIVHWQMPELDLEFWDLPELDKPYVSTKPNDRQDGLSVGELGKDSGDKKQILALANDIADGQFGKIDSLLIAQNGKLLFESYFRRGRIDLPHPQSSASKAYTAFALGRAIQMGYLTMADLDRPLINFLGELDHSKLADGAELITLNHALTMRSGVRIEPEQWDSLQWSPEQLKGQGLAQAYLELSAPITPETQVFKYQNDPMLVMQVINAVVPGGADKFIKTELFDKLGVTNFAWQLNEQSGLPESASITSRTMVKFGMLALNRGKLNGEQFIPKEFVAIATSQLFKTSDDVIFGGGKDVSNQGYGYYWWSTDLAVGNERYFAASAQGGGGMYLFVIDALDLIVVVTAHHRDEATQQMTAERILPAFVTANDSAAALLRGPYLGQKPPGKTPELFAPNVISTEGWEYGVVFAPGMQEMYFVREVDADTAPKQQFVVYEQDGEQWSARVLGKRVGTATLSPDNQMMFFGRGFKTRTAIGWSPMQRLGPDFEDIRIMRVTSSALGTIAFDEATQEGDSVLRYSRLINGRYSKPQPFPAQINTGKWNAHPFIAPDERFVIWDGQRGNEQPNADLYIAFRTAEGEWGEAIKLGSDINTQASEFAAHITPDGKYLFFNRTSLAGNTDTYWVDAAVLERYRPK